MQKFFSISLVALFHLTNALGQQTIFKTYSVSDGLVNNAIRKIYQDSKGFLWISTWEGLSKYDGNHFTNFTESNGLSHNMVNDVVETANGDIYVAENNGSVDVIRKDHVLQKGIFQDIVINKFLTGNGGDLVALTDNSGIVHIEGTRINPLMQTKNSAFYNIAQINDSLIAAATDTVPINVLNKKFEVWGASKKRLDRATANYVFKDQQNRLWLGTTSGLKLVNIDNTREINFSKIPAPFNDPVLAQASISSIFQQQNGTFLFGTDQGLVIISSEGRVERLTEKDGLPSRTVNYIFSDRENNLWIGTTMGLVKIIAPSPVRLYDPSGESPHTVQFIKKISGNDALIFSSGLLYNYNFRTGTIKEILRLNKADQLLPVANSSPYLFLHNGDLKLYDSAVHRLKQLKKISDLTAFFSATQASDGSIFIAGFDGLVIVAKNKVRADSTFPMRINNVIADENGYVWIGTWFDGLFRGKYNSATNRWSDITHFIQLPDNHIRSLFEDKEGNIWAGTRFNGIIRVSEKGAKQFQFFHRNQQSGLISNWISDIAEDEKGNIWLATMSGLDKLVRESDSFSIFNYSRIVNFLARPTLITWLQKSKLFCSSFTGSFLVTDEELEKLPPKPVYLTRLILGDSSQNEISKDEKVALSYSKNHAAFEFTFPTFLNERETRYSYRLKGSVDTSWSIPSNVHSVQYASLEPGHYQFEVRMLGWNGGYGPITTFLFSVEPPYWKTWWFYSLIGLCILLLTFLLYRYRINQLLRVQKVRTNIATDLHDDIGSTLTNIGILSELSKKNLEQTPVAEKYLERITEESLASQQALDDIIWSVNSRNDNLRELEARMRRYIAEVFETSNVSCHFSFENDTDSGRLNMEQRRDLYLVFKECMNNIYKHAGAKNISVSILVKNGVLWMNINDDGKGFDPELITDRNGLKNLKTRVKKWRGTLKIHAGAGKGSDIQISMPVK